MAERTRNPSLTVTRTLGAVALVVIGGVHYRQYHDGGSERCEDDQS